MEVIETPTSLSYDGHEFSFERGNLVALGEDAAREGDERALEVGAGAGISAHILAPFFRAYFCVDPYEADYSRLPDIMSSPERLAAAKRIFLDWVLPRHPNIHWVRQPSPGAADLFGSELFDLVYLDGCHDYLAVCADICAWKRLIRPGGSLAGHDFTVQYDGVRRAVRGLLGEPKYYSGGHWRIQFQPTS